MRSWPAWVLRIRRDQDQVCARTKGWLTTACSCRRAGCPRVFSARRRPAAADACVSATRMRWVVVGAISRSRKEAGPGASMTVKKRLCGRPVSGGLLGYTVPRSTLAATPAACARLRGRARLKQPVSSTGGPVHVEPGVMTPPAHADGRVSRTTARANCRMKLTVWRVTPAKLAGSALRQTAAYAER